MSRVPHSLTPPTHCSLVLPSCRRWCWLLLRAGGLAHVGCCWRRWYRYLGRAILQGLPAQIHFWAVRDGSDGVPRRANLAEPVPWTQAGSWPLMSPLQPWGPLARVRGCVSGSFPHHGDPPSCRLPGAGRDQRCSVSRAHPCLPSPMGTRALWGFWVRVAGPGLTVRRCAVRLGTLHNPDILIPSFASLLATVPLTQHAAVSSWQHSAAQQNKTQQ